MCEPVNLFIVASFSPLRFTEYCQEVAWIHHWSVFNLVGMVSVVELKQSSVMQRLLVGWMPTAIR